MNTDERTVTNVNEFDANVVNNECAEPKKRSTMWQNMSIGGVGGIALGVASSFFTIGSGHAAETPELNHLDLSAADIPVANAVNAEMSFEDKLLKFKQDSDEKIQDLKRNTEGKRNGGYKRSY